MPPDLTRIDGYSTRGSLNDSVARFHLVEDDRGNVMLRVIDGSAEALLEDSPMPIAVVAVDLAGSHEPRERAAGIRVLERLLR